MGFPYLNFELKWIQKKLTKVVTLRKLYSYNTFELAGNYCCFTELHGLCSTYHRHFRFGLLRWPLYRVPMIEYACNTG
jgi:hypothetical protein